MNVYLLSTLLFFLPGIIVLIFHRPLLRWLDRYFIGH